MQMWRTPSPLPFLTTSRVVSNTLSRNTRTTMLISEGSSSEKTRSKVSCEGPWASGPRKIRAILSFSRLLQNASMAWKLFTPPSTARKANTMMFFRGWRTLPPWRGSCTLPSTSLMRRHITRLRMRTASIRSKPSGFIRSTNRKKSSPMPTPQCLLPPPGKDVHPSPIDEYPVAKWCQCNDLLIPLPQLGAQKALQGPGYALGLEPADLDVLPALTRPVSLPVLPARRPIGPQQVALGQPLAKVGGPQTLEDQEIHPIALHRHLSLHLGHVGHQPTLAGGGADVFVDHQARVLLAGHALGVGADDPVGILILFLEVDSLAFVPHQPVWVCHVLSVLNNIKYIVTENPILVQGFFSTSPKTTRVEKLGWGSWIWT